MMRISEHRNVIIMLAASFALFAQSDDFPVKSQDHSSVPDVRQIVESSIAATQRHWQARLHYTYMEREESRRRDLAGRVKSEDVDVSRTILVNGVPFEQLEERNGQPPSVEEERKQKEKLDKLKRETPEQRAERLRKQEEENTSLVREVPKAFDFQLVGEEAVNGRLAYVLQVRGRLGPREESRPERVSSIAIGELLRLLFTLRRQTLTTRCQELLWASSPMLSRLKAGSESKSQALA